MEQKELLMEFHISRNKNGSGGEIIKLVSLLPRREAQEDTIDSTGCKVILVWACVGCKKKKDNQTPLENCSLGSYYREVQNGTSRKEKMRVSG